jgi:hypothetical protein
MMMSENDLVGSWQITNEYGSECVEVFPDGSCVYQETVVVPGEYGYYEEKAPRYGRVRSVNGRGVVTWQDGESWEFQYQRKVSHQGHVLTLLYADGSQQQFKQK